MFDSSSIINMTKKGFTIESFALQGGEEVSNGLMLVTDDEKLKAKASKYVRVLSSSELTFSSSKG